MDFAIEVKGITKTYKKSLVKQVKALRGLSFDINQGEIFGFVGPNGAGKSTFIKIAMGLLFPDKGSVFFFGKPSVQPKSRIKVGYVPEQPILYSQLTGAEYITFACRLYGEGKKQCRERIDFYLEKVGLQDAASRPIRTYSKGMQQRLAIAQALIANPDIVILDEPLSGLDPIGRMDVQNLLVELNEQGKTIFFSSHILHDVESVCHRVAFIVKGELKYLGSPENIEKIFKESLGL